MPRKFRKPTWEKKSISLKAEKLEEEVNDSHRH